MHSVDVSVSADHPAFGGHFPGQPLLPGVSLLAEVLEAVMCEPALMQSVGPAPRIATVKFLAPVRPGSTLSLQLDGSSGAVRFEVRSAQTVVAFGNFEPAR